MLLNDLIISLSFVLAVVSLISVLFTEKKALFGVLTLVLFGFFYYQNSITGTFDSITILMFVMGITLLSLEIFIPSFGVIGVVGAGLSLYAVINSYSDNMYSFWILIVSALAIVLTVTIYVKLGFANNLFDGYILNSQNSSERGYRSKATRPDLIGASGVSKTILRPSGKIEIDGAIYDAQTEGDFINKGACVKVHMIKDGNIIVREEIWNS